MTTLALADVYSVVEEFSKKYTTCFLSGSYRFGRATAKSDIDIVFPIMFKQDVLGYIKEMGYTGVQESHYNAGVKFTKMMGDRAQSINAVFLHPLDFVCWFKAANMINAANAGIKAMARPEFHALHQIMVSLPKMMIKDCVTSDNYRDYLK
jgi:hypothetical protein